MEKYLDATLGFGLMQLWSWWLLRRFFSLWLFTWKRQDIFFNPPNEDSWSIYEGEFYRNNFEGCGALYLRNNTLYVGTFHNDYLKGFGTIYYYNGDRFEGIFKQQKKRKFGPGQLFKSNGDRYEGDWTDDILKSGVLTHAKKKFSLLIQANLMMEIFLKIRNMVKERNFIRMEISTKENGRMI